MVGPELGWGGWGVVFGVVVAGGAGEVQGECGRVGFDVPVGVVFEQVVSFAVGGGVVGCGGSALGGVVVVERGVVVDVASPGGLSAGGELAGGVLGGGVVAEVLLGSVGECSGVGGGSGGGVGQVGGDGGCGGGDAAGEVGGDGAEPAQEAGEVV